MKLNLFCFTSLFLTSGIIRLAFIRNYKISKRTSDSTAKIILSFGEGFFTFPKINYLKYISRKNFSCTTSVTFSISCSNLKHQFILFHTTYPVMEIFDKSFLFTGLFVGYFENRRFNLTGTVDLDSGSRGKLRKFQSSKKSQEDLK